MRTRVLGATAAAAGVLLAASCQRGGGDAVSVPMVLDHNRMLVEAELQRADGSWRKARLWVDTGNPDFILSRALALDLGLDLGGAKHNTAVQPPAGMRIGGTPIDIQGVRTVAMFEPKWLFTATHMDANLPSTVLERYRVVFDYPRRRLMLSPPGRRPPRGVRCPASIHPETGIVQVDALVDGDSLSFALDNGASYSFMSGEVLARLTARNPGWPHVEGTLGCANMWGWWPPDEMTMPVVQVPEIRCGAVRFAGVGVVGASAVSPNGPSLGAWYSHKTARPVDGFLGPNAFLGCRVEIDYAGSAVYFAPGTTRASHDMDVVGLCVRPEDDGRYRVLGVAERDGRPAVEGVQPGDWLLRIGTMGTTGATMGKVVDALRGKPGETRSLYLERGGGRLTVEATVQRFW